MKGVLNKLFTLIARYQDYLGTFQKSESFGNINEGSKEYSDEVLTSNAHPSEDNQETIDEESENFGTGTTMRQIITNSVELTEIDNLFTHQEEADVSLCDADISKSAFPISTSTALKPSRTKDFDK